MSECLAFSAVLALGELENKERRSHDDEKKFRSSHLHRPPSPFHVHAGWKCLYKSRGPHYFCSFFFRKKVFLLSSVFSFSARKIGERRRKLEFLLLHRKEEQEEEDREVEEEEMNLPNTQGKEKGGRREKV